VAEGGLAVVEGLKEAVAGDHRSDRGVARAHALGAGDDVGHIAEIVTGEHRSDAAERADHLVGDQQHVVFVADLPDPLEVTGRWREAAPGVLHWLEEHRADGVGAFELDGLGDPVGAVAAPRFDVGVVRLRSAIEVGVGHSEPARGQRLEGRLEVG
jgi:hypothetical protein